MKKLPIYFVALMALLVAACRKNDNPRVPDFDKLPLPKLVLGDGATNKIPGADPLAFESNFTLDLHYPNGDKPKQFDVVVMRNGDKSNVKTLQAEVTSFPTEITITGQQLADLFGASPDYGDVFVVGVDVVTQDGKRWDAFPAEGITYAPGIAAEPGTNPTIQFQVPCQFDPAEFTSGDYEVLVDEWADYSAGDLVPVVKIDDTHYSFTFLAGAPQPIVMEIDPVTNAITVEPVVYGNYGPGLDVTAKSVPGDDSEVDPCNLVFSVKLNHTYSGGNLGDYVIKLRKVN